SDHVLRRIDTERRAAGNPRGDFRRDLSVPAADVENPLAAFQRQVAELLLRHRLLKARLAVIVARMPLRHEMPSGAALTPTGWEARRRLDRAEQVISLRPTQPIPAAGQRFRRARPRPTRLTARRPPVKRCACLVRGDKPRWLQPWPVRSSASAIRPIDRGIE